MDYACVQKDGILVENRDPHFPDRISLYEFTVEDLPYFQAAQKEATHRWKLVCPCCGGEAQPQQKRGGKNILSHAGRADQCFFATLDMLQATPFGALTAANRERRRRYEFGKSVCRFDERYIRHNREAIKEWECERGISLNKERRTIARYLVGKNNEAEVSYLCNAMSAIEEQCLSIVGLHKHPEYLLPFEAFLAGQQNRNGKPVAFLPNGDMYYRKKGPTYKSIDMFGREYSIWLPGDLYLCFVNSGGRYKYIHGNEGRGDPVVYEPLSRRNSALDLGQKSLERYAVS